MPDGPALISWFSFADKTVATMLLLMGVVWLAIRFGWLTAVLAAAAGVAAIDFFFLAPYYALGPSTTEDLVTLVVFTLTAIITSGLAARAREQSLRHREQALIAEERSAEVAILLSIMERIATAHTATDLKSLIEDEIGPMLQLTDTLKLITPSGIAALAEADRAGALAALESGLPTGRGTKIGAVSGLTFIPLASADRATGLLIAKMPVGEAAQPRRLRMLAAVGRQIGIACERARLSAEIAEARVLADTERFQAALLASVSHDFRTPLGAIMGAASSLLSADASFSPETRRDLLLTVYNSAERINRYVRNLLDITTIDSGAVRPARDWVDLTDIIGTALAAIEHNLAGRPVTVAIPPDLPLLRLDFILIERVLLNLLDNAIKFSLPWSAIDIAVTRQYDEIVLTMFNEGSLVAEADLERLFDKFFRGTAPRGSSGVGLGLSICRGFMAAHGGSILAKTDWKRTGMTFELIFPFTPGGPDHGVEDD